MKERNISFSPPDIGKEEIEEVIDVLRSGWITTGPKTKLFEKQIAESCGTKRAVCLNSATAGLELALRILGIGKGDEVITSAYTYTASASVIEHVGAKIVLCDIAPSGYEMDYDKLPELITERTKAIIPVDIAGKVCDYDKLYKIVNEAAHKFKPSNEIQEKFGRIILLADGAHSFGAERHNLKSGNIADITVFSFHAVKNLTTAEGGAVTWRENPAIDDEEFYKLFMLWSLHGQSKDALAKTQIGQYDRYYGGHRHCTIAQIPVFACSQTRNHRQVRRGNKRQVGNNARSLRRGSRLFGTSVSHERHRSERAGEKRDNQKDGAARGCFQCALQATSHAHGI